MSLSGWEHLMLSPSRWSHWMLSPYVMINMAWRWLSPPYYVTSLSPPACCFGTQQGWIWSSGLSTPAFWVGQVQALFEHGFEAKQSKRMTLILTDSNPVIKTKVKTKVRGSEERVSAGRARLGEGDPTWKE